MILAATSLLSISAAMVGASTLLCTRSSAALLSITNLMLPGKAKSWLDLCREKDEGTRRKLCWILAAVMG
jgi:hypothetical protein